MRILLRDSRNGLFYAGCESWTDDHLQAAEFPDTSQAMDEAWEKCLNDIEIVMRFEDPFLEIPLSIVARADEAATAED
jgi:hypothetical protein